jgi:hypothetical protein
MLLPKLFTTSLFLGSCFFLHDVQGELTDSLHGRSAPNLSSPFSAMNRDQTLKLPTYGIVTDSQLVKAQSLVDEALVRIGRANKHLHDNPRRNTYDKTPGAAHNQRHTELDVPYTVSEELAAAAAMLAEYDARISMNSTSEPNVFEKRATPFWMESIKHSGSLPFGNDLNYKACG